MNQNALSDQSLKIHKHLTAAFQGFDRMDICMLGVMPDGRIAFANRPAGQMLGYLQKELVGVSIQTVAPEFTSEAWSVFWSAIDQKGFVENHPPLLLRPSSQKEFMAGCIAFRIQSDAEKGCILFLAPSEKMPAAIINVQEHRSELIPMLDVMANPVIAIDAHYKFTFINRAACRSFGATLFEATGKTFHDYVPKKSADSLLKKMQAVITSGVPATYVGKGFLRAKYGDSITLLPFFDPSSCQKRLLAVINSTAGPAADLTAHRPQSDTTPHSLPLSADAADGYRAMETGAIGICLKDACNRLVWMNQSFAAMVGFEPKDLIGKRPDDVINDPKLITDLRREDDFVLTTGRPLFNLEKHPRGNLKKIHRVDKLPLVDKNGDIKGIFVLVVEVDKPVDEADTLKQRLALTTRKLDETETALRVLLEQTGKEISTIRDTLGNKVKTLLVPYLETLRQTALQGDQLDYIDLIEENLKIFYDPVYANLSAPESKLSPTELKVAQLIRDGKTNKEIAKMLNLSKSTILTHRHHVRVKLGIRNKKVNLRSLLKS